MVDWSATIQGLVKAAISGWYERFVYIKSDMANPNIQIL